MKIVFKNLEPSNLARGIVEDKLSPVFDKFPHLAHANVTVTLEMENSPAQAGPDLFNAWVVIKGTRTTAFKLKRSDTNLYRAVSQLEDALMEKLSGLHHKTVVSARLGKRQRSTRELNS